MQPTNQERQMLETLREPKSADGFQLVVAVVGGVWEIELSDIVRGGKVVTGRGAGATFDEAWDNVTGLGIDLFRTVQRWNLETASGPVPGPETPSFMPEVDKGAGVLGYDSSPSKP
jgi:hypothetical protein